MSLSVSTPTLSPFTTLSSLSLPSPSPPTSAVPSSSTAPPSSSATPTSSAVPTSTSATPTTSSTPVPSSSTSSSAASSSSSVASTSSLASTSDAVALPSSSSTSAALVTAGGAGALPLASSSAVVLTPSTATSIPTVAPSSSSSPSGFFSNTGAVAGTFTVVGLVGIASVITVILLVAKRRHSRSYEDDAEFLDKNPDSSPDPPMAQVTSFDDGFSSDQGHYTAPPMAVANPPTAYYPDHAYAFHPQAFPAEGYPQQLLHNYPVAYPQDSVAQRIYSPDDYDIAYPPAGSRVVTNIPNSHVLTRAEPDSAPVLHTRTGPPLALRPSVRSTPAARANSRMSIDSFYAGIATDTLPSHGQAL